MYQNLEKLYERMYLPESVQTPLEKNNGFSKFGLTDYTEMVYGKSSENVVEEGKSGHGDEKAVLNSVKEGIASGLLDSEKCKRSKNGWLLYSAIDGSMTGIHNGERAFHYLRRYLEYLERVKKDPSLGNDPRYMRRTGIDH